MEKQSLKTFSEALFDFEKLEQKFDLPSWRINNVYVWKLVRFKIFSEYTIACGIGSDSHPEKKRLNKNKIRKTLDFVRHIIFRNPFFFRKSGVTRIIIPHDRKRIINDKAVDPISYSAWSGKYNSTSVVLDKISPIDYRELKEFPSFFVIKKFSDFYKLFIKFKFSSKDIEIIGEIENYLKKTSKTEKSFMLKNKIQLSIENFLAQKRIFKYYLSRINPSYLYLVVSYGKESIIAAANELHIKTIEYQHGSLGRGHLGYDFKNWLFVPYFPEIILGFGNNWFIDVSIPEHVKVLPVGAPQLEASVNQSLKQFIREKNLLLVFSQAPSMDQLTSALAEFCDNRPDWNIIVRPHPSESIDNLKQALERKMKNKTKRIIFDKSTLLTDQAARANVAFGVNSTALLEALLCGCKVAILGTEAGGQYFQKLIEEEAAFVVNDGKELASSIESLPKGSARDYFNKPVDDVILLVENKA